MQEHLDHAAGLPADTLDALRALAVQLDGRRVVPLVGAGGSVDCGMRLARDLGRDLLDDYRADTSFAPHAAGLGGDLGDVAEAILQSSDQATVVRMLGLSDPALWPAAGQIPDHFCGYRVLGRCAREGLLEQALTLNYDCGYEAGLANEGFALARDVVPGRRWPDHAIVIADARGGNSPYRQGSFTLRKIHGCAEHYRAKRAADPGSGAEHDIVICRSQLDNWRTDLWAQDHLRAVARSSVLLLIGFSGQDPVIAGELRQVLRDVYGDWTPNGEPRVVAIDYEPDTAMLRSLLNEGLGGAALAPGMVNAVRTRGGTVTAALVVLLAEMLLHRLAAHLGDAGYDVPAELDARIAVIVLAAPVMLRWSYLLRPAEDPGLHHANLHLAAERGYVPLTHQAALTARMLAQRQRLRVALGSPGAESTREVLAAHGFVEDRRSGTAYLPTGLPDDVLASACRPAGPAALARAALGAPRIECVMIGEHHGFNLRTGKEVPVP